MTKFLKYLGVALTIAFFLSACKPDKTVESPRQEPGGSAVAPDKLEQAVKYELSKDDKAVLLHIARLTVDTWVRDRKAPEFDIGPERKLLLADGAAFVTLNKNDQLRGCIGHTIAREPLWMCVRDVAMAAATNDTRFRPVRPEELDDIVVEVSVLTPLERVSDPDKLVMGRDGVVLKHGQRVGVFLPQVATDTGWTRDIFLGQLCRQKARLPWNCWKNPATELYKFEAIVFEEEHKSEESVKDESR